MRWQIDGFEIELDTRNNGRYDLLCEGLLVVGGLQFDALTRLWERWRNREKF